jgi:hypothetical protein
MGKYSPVNYVPPKPRNPLPNPLWRGIGCILMVVIPLISFTLAELTVQNDLASQYIPYQFLGYPNLPPVLWVGGYANSILYFLQNQNNLYAALIFTVIYIIALGGLISAVSAYFYQASRSSRYGPLDVPPPGGKVKRYKR